MVRNLVLCNTKWLLHIAAAIFSDMEKWKDIPDYNGLYQVSNLGRIRSLKFGKERIMKQATNPGGYKQVNLFKDGKRTKHIVHRLVALQFIPNPTGKKEVHHKKGKRADNRASQLEWVTRVENCKAIDKEKKYISYPKLFSLCRTYRKLSVGQFLKLLHKYKKNVRI